MTLMAYDPAIIRKLIEAAFATDGDLRVFCSDHYYLPVYRNFTQGQSMDDRVLLLLDYVRRSEREIERLLSLIKTERLDIYAQFEPDLSSQSTETPPDPAIANALAITKEGLQVDQSPYRRTFQKALDHIKVINDLKELHDDLHDLQYSCFPNIILEVQKIFDDKSEDKDAGPNLSEHQRNFATYVKGMKNHIDSLKQYARDQFKEGDSYELREYEENAKEIEKLDMARLDLKDGIEDYKQEQVTSAMVTINNVIDTLPTAVDGKLFAEISVQVDRLQELVSLMNDEYNRLNPDVENAKRIKRGIAELKLMTTDIDSLMKEHTTWQEADSMLRTLKDILQESIEEKRISQAFVKPWHRLQQKVARFYTDKAEEWARDLQKIDDRMKKALDTASIKAAAHELLTPKECKSLENAFMEFRGAAMHHFLEVDKLLLENCTKLNKVREDVEVQTI
jgi:hypothetical protein